MVGYIIKSIMIAVNSVSPSCGRNKNKLKKINKNGRNKIYFIIYKSIKTL